MIDDGPGIALARHRADLLVAQARLVFQGDDLAVRGRQGGEGVAQARQIARARIAQADAGHARDVVDRRRPHALHTAEVREQRLAMEKEAEGVKARETEIHNVILSALSESSDTGASGKKYRVQLVNKTRQHVKDWPSLFSFIRQYDLFDLLQKRLSDKAAAEFVETYKQPLPGVENVDVPTLSFNKI